MSAESTLQTLLTPILGRVIYFNVAPLGAPTPRIVAQQAGGEEDQFLDGSLASKERPRMQIACWATTYLVAKTLSKQVAQAVSTSALQGQPLGAAVAVYEEATSLHGFRQDFLIAADR